MSVRIRLKQIIDEKGVTPYELSKQTGISQATLSRLLSGETSKPSISNTDKIAKYLQLNRDWLLTGKGEMLKSEGSRNEGRVIENPNIMEVPVISKYAYAGYIAGFEDVDFIDSLPTIPFILPDNQTPKGDYVAIEVRGDSMDDGTDESLKDGDTLLCRKIHNHLWTGYKLHIRKWNFVIVCYDGIVVKRIVDHDVEKHTITIHSLNEIYPNEVIDLAEVREIFNVVQLMRKPVL